MQNHINFIDFIFSASYALKCYKCSSSHDVSCKDPVQISRLEEIECSSGDTCVKHILRLTVGINVGEFQRTYINDFSNFYDPKKSFLQMK